MKLKFILPSYFAFISSALFGQIDTSFQKFYQNELLANQLVKELKMADSLGLDELLYSDSTYMGFDLLMDRLEISEDSVMYLHLSKHEYVKYDFLMRNDELPDIKSKLLRSELRLIKEGVGEDWDGNIDGLPAYSSAQEKKSDYFLKKIKKMLNQNPQASKPYTYESYRKEENEMLPDNASESELIQYRFLFIRYLNEKKHIPIPG